MQKAYLKSWEDERAGRDPATFTAGRSIEFCLASPGRCPGAAPVASSSDDEDDGGADGPVGVAGPVSEAHAGMRGSSIFMSALATITALASMHASGLS